MNEPIPSDDSPAGNALNTPAAAPLVPTYQSPDLPAAGKRPFALGEILSWLVVLAIVALTAISVGIEQRREADAGPDTSGTQLALSAKYGIGINTLFHLPGTATQLLTQLDDAAKSPPDRLRVAIVAGELSGSAEALRRLGILTSEENDLKEDIATAEAYYRDPPLPEVEDFDPVRPPATGPIAADPRGADRREAFHKKWGWFADVAEAHGKAPTEPARTTMLAPTYRVVAAILGVVLLGGSAGLIGLVLLIVALVLLTMGKLKPAYGKVTANVPALPRDRRAYIEGLALFIFLYFGAGYALRHLIHLPDAALTVIGLILMPTSALIGLFWPRIRGGTWREWRATFGLHTGRGFFREIFAGFLGYLAGIPIMIAGLILMLVLVKLANVRPSHPITNALEDGGILLIALVFLAASVWAPITEELLFRGALFSHLRERFRPLFSGIVVGLLFALVHPQGWPLVPVLGAIGFNFAMIREWRGSIIPCMTAHAIHNTLTLAFALTILR